MFSSNSSWSGINIQVLAVHTLQCCNLTIHMQAVSTAEEHIFNIECGAFANSQSPKAY